MEPNELRSMMELLTVMEELCPSLREECTDTVGMAVMACGGVAEVQDTGQLASGTLECTKRLLQELEPLEVQALRGWFSGFQGPATAWQWIAAIFLIVVSFPFWFAICIIWGLMKATVTFVELWNRTSFESLSVWDWEEDLWAWGIDAWGSVFSVPAAIWTWSTEHPAFAVVIGVVMSLFFAVKNRRQE